MLLDFTNYTFCALVSLLAAILGIGYPLFLESIRKIDEQYDSTHLSARFQRERVFLCYRMALLSSIVTSFCAPFLMLLLRADEVSIIVVAVQSASLLWLVFQMLFMFQVIQDYYDPMRLIDRIHLPEPPIEFGSNGLEELLCLIDLARYSSRRKNFEAYSRCKRLILHITNKEEAATSTESLYNVSQGVFSAFRLIAEYSRDTNNTYFANDNIAAQAFYNYLIGYHTGPQTYKLLWQQACIVADGGTEEWFRQYWSYAVQYYAFRLEPKLRHEDERMVLYKEQHFMIGVLSMFYERYDWLDIILFHSHVHPPQYPLVPCTFIAIYEAVVGLESQRNRVWKLTEKYQMKGLFADVNSDDKLLHQAYRYAALLMIRLFSVNDYNITYSNPMEIPYINPDANILNLKEELRIANRLKWHVTQWYEEGTINQVNLPILPPQADVENLLSQYITAIEGRMQYNQEHPELDVEKIRELKALLVESDNRKGIEMPTHAEDAFTDTPVSISISQKLDNETTAIGGYPGWSNFPDVLISLLNQKIGAYYDGLFVFITSEVFTINEKNVFKALEMVHPDGNDIIIALGIYLPNYDMIFNQGHKLRYEGDRVYYHETEVTTRSSDQSSIIVIRRDMQPTISYLPPTDEMQLHSISELQDSDLHLCTNLDRVIADNQPAPVVTLSRNVRSHIPEGAKAIRIVVSRSSDDTVEMSRLKMFFEQQQNHD